MERPQRQSWKAWISRAYPLRVSGLLVRLHWLRKRSTSSSSSQRESPAAEASNILLTKARASSRPMPASTGGSDGALGPTGVMVIDLSPEMKAAQAPFRNLTHQQR